MSPRSEEFMTQAREGVAAAGDALLARHFGSAVRDSYYAMLYAVRAALSEEDLHARTHSGLWHLFHERFVAAGRFDTSLHAEAHSTQARREGVDYGAETVEPEEAERIAALADRFVGAVDHMLGGPQRGT